MARQIIDTTTNNGTYIGDPAKVAFEKVNSNDAELYSTKATKGSNGTWPDAIPDAPNLFNSVSRIRTWGAVAANAPLAGTYGIVSAWSSRGDFVKSSGNWISMVGWVTNGDMFFTISVNGNEFIPWRRIWNTGNTTVDANNFIKAI